MKVLITVGGTGGHIYPALAIAEELCQRMDAEVVLVGTGRPLEERILGDRPYRYVVLPARPFGMRRPGQAVAFLWSVVRSLFQSIILLRRERPCVVVGTGGYVSVPPVVAARLLMIPTLVHEQNVIPGRATRLVAPLAQEVHLTFSQSSRYLRCTRGCLVSGNPLRKDIGKVSQEEGIRRLGLEAGRMTVLVMGGSRGARAINQVMVEVLGQLSPRWPVQVLVQCGAEDVSWMREAARSSVVPVRVVDFIDEMSAAYAASDLVIARAGATTVAELAAVRRASILIPYPFATEGHQEVNARYLEGLGAARVIIQDNLTGRSLSREIEYLLEHEELRRKMGERAGSVHQPDAARRISDGIIRCGKPKGSFSPMGRG